MIQGIIGGATVVACGGSVDSVDTVVGTVERPGELRLCLLVPQCLRQCSGVEWSETALPE